MTDNRITIDVAADADIIERISAAARAFLDRMPAELRAETEALLLLGDGSDLGVRVHYLRDADVFDLVWVGRWLGSVDGPWARGEAG